MKKVSIAIMILLLLSSCKPTSDLSSKVGKSLNSNNITDQTNNTGWDNKSNYSLGTARGPLPYDLKNSTKESVFLWNRWTYSNAIYYFQNPDLLETEIIDDENYTSPSNPKSRKYNTHDLLLYAHTKVSRQTMVLCNKANCKHISSSCNAYFTAPDDSNINPTFSTIFIYDKTIFLSYGNDFFSLNLDGTDRKLLFSIDEKFRLGKFYYCNEKIYVTAMYLDISVSEENPTPVQKEGLFEIDIINKSYKELYFFIPEEEYSHVLHGIYKDKAYYIQTAGKEMTVERTQKNLDNHLNSFDRYIYYINISNGQRKELLHKKSFEIDNVFVAENKMYYHSRNDSTIYGLDFETDKITAVNKDIKGYISIDYLLDGNLFGYHDNYGNDIMADPPPDVDYFYINLKTGEKIDIKNPLPDNIEYTIRSKKDDYYYLIVDLDMTNDKQQLGRIKIEDFYNGKYDKIEKLDWYKGTDHIAELG